MSKAAEKVKIPGIAFGLGSRERLGYKAALGYAASIEADSPKSQY